MDIGDGSDTGAAGLTRTLGVVSDTYRYLADGVIPSTSLSDLADRTRELIDARRAKAAALAAEAEAARAEATRAAEAAEAARAEADANRRQKEEEEEARKREAAEAAEAARAEATRAAEADARKRQEEDEEEEEEDEEEEEADAEAARAALGTSILVAAAAAVHIARTAEAEAVSAEAAPGGAGVGGAGGGGGGRGGEGAADNVEREADGFPTSLLLDERDDAQHKKRLINIQARATYKHLVDRISECTGITDPKLLYPMVDESYKTVHQLFVETALENPSDDTSRAARLHNREKAKEIGPGAPATLHIAPTSGLSAREILDRCTLEAAKKDGVVPVFIDARAISADVSRDPSKQKKKKKKNNRKKAGAGDGDEDGGEDEEPEEEEEPGTRTRRRKPTQTTKKKGAASELYGLNLLRNGTAFSLTGLCREIRTFFVMAQQRLGLFNQTPLNMRKGTIDALICGLDAFSDEMFSCCKVFTQHAKRITLQREDFRGWSTILRYITSPEAHSNDLVNDIHNIIFHHKRLHTRGAEKDDRDERARKRAAAKDAAAVGGGGGGGGRGK